MPDNIVGSAWVKILPDLSGFESDLFAKLDVSMKKVQAFADARPITLRVNLDTAQAIAQLTALKIAAGGIGGGGGGFGTGALAGAAGSSGGGGGFLTGAALTRLIGFGPGGGTGANIPFTPFAMAGVFSAASFAGLGLEHVLFTLVGLAGSLAGAFAGLGVLAVGALGKIGVGMGSDAVVMSSTIADTKTLYNALTAIQTAQLQYGKNSTQAAAATQQLNIQMALIGNTAGVKAELGLAKAGQALNTFWDKATSSARVAAVGFITPFISIADTYIPLINAAATKNFTIMTTAFKPFIDWANGPVATGIFNNLEKMFAQDIPIGVNALTQFVELLAKIANWAAPQSGGLLDTISKWLTKENTPAGFTKLTGTMQTLINMFHDWSAFLVIAFKDIVDIFKLTAGLGTGIVGTLTQMLTQLHNWLNLTSTQKSLHNLFETHKQEVLEILQLLPPVLKGLSDIYLTIAPPLTFALTKVLGVIVKILDATVSNPFGAWLVGLGLIFAKLGLLGGLLSGLKGGIAAFFGIGGGKGGVATGLEQLTGALGQRVFVTNWPPGFGGAGTSAYDDYMTSKLGGAAPAIAEDTGVLAAGGLGAAGAGETSVIAGIIGSGAVATALAAAAPAVALAVIAYFGWQSILKEDQKTPAQQAKDAKAIRDAAQNKTTLNPRDFMGTPNLPMGTNADPLNILVSANQAKAGWSSIAADIVSIQKGIGAWEVNMKPDLQHMILGAGEASTAMGDIATLVKAGKITNATSLANYETAWNTIQTHTKQTGNAQRLFTSMVATGYSDTKTNVANYDAAWNTLINKGIAPASIDAVAIKNQIALTKEKALAVTEGFSNLANEANATAQSIADDIAAILAGGRASSSASSKKNQGLPHALGGFIAPGGWGTASEDEIVLGGNTGATVLTAAQSRGARSVTINQYFQNNSTREFRDIIHKENDELVRHLTAGRN